MSLLKSCAGINITGTKLQVVEIGIDEGKVTLLNADEENLSEEMNFDCREAKFISMLQDAYDKIAYRNKFSYSNVSISLPSRIFYNFSFPVDNKLHTQELNEHIDWEFSVLYPFEDPANFIIQNFKTGVNESELQVLALKQEIAKKVHKFCVRNNLALNLVDLSHLAFNNYLTHFGNDNGISFYLGKSGCSYSVIENGSTGFLKVRDFQIEEESNTIAENLIDEIFEAEEYNSMDVFVAGEYYSLLSEFLSDKQKSNRIKVVNPFDNLKVKDMVIDIEAVNETNKYASAMGIALRGIK